MTHPSACYHCHQPLTEENTSGEKDLSLGPWAAWCDWCAYIAHPDGEGEEECDGVKCRKPTEPDTGTLHESGQARPVATSSQPPTKQEPLAPPPLPLENERR